MTSILTLSFCYNVVIIFSIFHNAASQILPLGYPCESISEPTNVTETDCLAAVVNCSWAEASRYRTIDGVCNNLKHSLWGSVGSPFTRLAMRHRLEVFNYPPEFKSKNNMAVLPNARRVSQVCHSGKDNTFPHLTTMLMQFGQFIDHDITLTPEVNLCHASCNGTEEINCCDFVGQTEHPKSCLPIAIPRPDGFHDFHSGQIECLDFKRSQPFVCNYSDEDVHSREQFNRLTSFVDASQVYGSTLKVANELRQFQDGLLATGDVGGLPFKKNMCGNEKVENSFNAGDIRVDENPGLQSMHTLWMREHNRLAAFLKRRHPQLDDEELYQSARRFLTAEYQNAVFSEFLPIILGPRLIQYYKLEVNKPSKYLPHISPNIFNGFATAAFRFGHSLITGQFNMISANLKKSQQQLRDHFFDISLVKGGNLESLLRGMCLQQPELINNIISEDLRNFLFKRKDEDFGGDLAARNIQRGRDHELGTYDAYRQTCGLGPLPKTFYSRPPREISREMWKRLKKVYANPRDIDLFPGGIGETPVEGAVVGPTFACIIGEQFRRLKFGDRYFFTHANVHRNLRFCDEELDMIRKRTLRDVICDNTEIENLPQDSFAGLEDGQVMVSCKRRNFYEPDPNCLASENDFDNQIDDGPDVDTEDQQRRIVVAAGGFDGWHLLSSVETYSPRGTCQHFIAPLPLPTYGSFLMFTGKDLVACGGRTSSGYGGNLCWRYQKRTANHPDKWVEDPGLTLNERRWFGAGVEASGRYLISGGIYSPLTTEYFDPVNEKWIPGPPLSQDRQKHCMVAVGDKVYILGGSGVSHVDEVNMDNNDIKSKRGLSAFRSRHSCTLLPDNNTVLLIGGSIFASKYELSTGNTYFGSDNVIIRSYSSVVRLGDRILIFGGQTHTSRVEEYDIEDDSFKILDIRMKIGRSRFAATTVPASLFEHFPGGCNP